MAVDPISAIIAGLFAVLNLGIALKFKRDLEAKLALEHTAFEAKINGEVEKEVKKYSSALKRRDEMYKYYKGFFSKLNEALKGFEELVAEPKILLDEKPFVAEYGEALKKWSTFTAYSLTEEDIGFSDDFLRELSLFKGAIEKLTLVLAVGRNERQRRLSVLPKYIAYASARRDNLRTIVRGAYAA